MNTSKRQFRSVFDKPPPQPDNIAEILSAVETVANKDNIGNLVRPSDTAKDEAAQPLASDNVTTLAPRRARKVTPAQTQKKTVELPTYVWDEILLKSAKEKNTQRYLVLQAFKDAGYTVHDIDLYKDGRRGN